VYWKSRFSKVSRGRSIEKRRFSRCVWMTLVSLFLTGLAVGQTATPLGNRAQTGGPVSQVTGSLSDGNAPITQSQAAALMEEMRRLEILLSSKTPWQQPDAPRNAAQASAEPVSLQLRATEHALGDLRAPIVMVEFADLQCPFCKDFEKSTFPELDSTYIKTGKMRFVVRDLPFANHPYAKPAAEAVR